MKEYQRYPTTRTQGRHVAEVASGSDADYKQAGKGKKGWRAAFWIALAVFVVALVALGVIIFSYFQGQQKYQNIAAGAFSAPINQDAASLYDFQVNWDVLLAQNPDTVGWIYIPGTVVNYPIVHTTNNEKYLTTDFSGDEAWLATYGAIFLAAENKGDFSNLNNIVYGHHMNDGSMFAAVDTFRDSAAFNAHRTIYILTPQGNYKLTTFALLIVRGDDPLAQPTFSTPEQMAAYVQDKMNRSIATPDPNTLTAADVSKMFAFVTCDYTVSDGRAVLFAAVVDSTVNSYLTNNQTSTSINPSDVNNVNNAFKEK